MDIHAGAYIDAIVFNLLIPLAIVVVTGERNLAEFASAAFKILLAHFCLANPSAFRLLPCLGSFFASTIIGAVHFLHLHP